MRVVVYTASPQDTLLPRFFGLYRLKLPGCAPVTLVSMTNVFLTSLAIHEQYDLKGSIAKRLVTEEERIKVGVLSCRVVPTPSFASLRFPSSPFPSATPSIPTMTHAT